MTAKGRIRDPDATVVEPVTRRLKLRNLVNVRHGTRKYRRSPDEDATSRKVDAEPTRHKGRSDSPRQSPKRASDQKIKANNFPTENSLERHLKEVENFDVTGAKTISKSSTGFADKRSLAPRKVSDQGATEEDCEFERVHREEDYESDFTRFKKGIKGGNEYHGSVGWSVLMKGPEHAEISKSDEEDMLHLSLPSTSEEPVLEGTRSNVDVTPSKRKQKRKNGVVKRPRPCAAKRSLSNHIFEILHPESQAPERLQTLQEPTKDSERVRTRAISQALCEVDDKGAPSAELSNVESAQKWEAGLAEEDAMDDREKLSHATRKRLLSSVTQKNGVISLHCVSVPRRKQRDNEEEQYSNNKRDVRAAVDVSDSQGFSTSDAIPRGKGVLKARNPTIDIEEDTPAGKALQKLKEQRYANAYESDVFQRDGGLDTLAKPHDNAALSSGSATTNENATDIEDSPRRRRKKSKSRRKYGSVRNESPTQTLVLPTGEDGYSMSKEAVDIGRLVRKQLLAGRGNSNELATSKGPSSTGDSSNADERSSDERVQPTSILDDSDDIRHQRIAEYSHKQANGGPTRVPKRPRTSCGTETKGDKNTLKIQEESNLTKRFAAEQTAMISPSRGNSLEFVQAEAEDCCLRLSGLGQHSAMEAKANSLGSPSRAPNDGVKSTKDPTSKGSYSRHSDSARLESAQITQHFDVKERVRESEPGSKKPEDDSLRDEELGVPGSIPGDMSHRNRMRIHKRNQREIRETLPTLVQCRPSQEQKKTPKQKKSPKSHVAPSSVVQVTREGQSTTRSATVLVPDLSEKVPGQPAIVQSGDEEEMDSVEAGEMSDHVSISTEDAEGTENVSMGENGSKQSQKPQPHPRKGFEIGPVLDERAPGVGTGSRLTKGKQPLNQTEKEDLGTVAKTSIEQNLDDLVDQKKLKEQSELLTKRSKRSRRSRVGARRDRSIKALDELSDNEDSKDEAWVPAASSSTQQQSRTKRVPKVQPQKTHRMKTRGRGSTSSRAPHELPAIIDLTDIGDDENTVTDTRGTEDDDDIAESLKELQRLSLEDKTKGISERPGCRYLTPLSDDESKLATDLTTRTKRDTKIVAIAEAGITLRGESFKRLRGTRWLDDEVLNAYVSLINSRNDAVFDEMDEGHRNGIPRTYVFNTYFFTRLSSGSSGFDYPGVKGWTKRAKVDILKRDVILIPINLGNHHWVLSGVDMEHKEVMYLDSMHGPDRVDAIPKLKRWVFEELRHKHGEAIAKQLDPNSWKVVKHSYRVRRVGVLPEKLEPRDARAGRMARVPRQADGGSCGVFTAKMADCLSLGIKVYFKQKDIHLIRRRMALDLFHGYVPL